MTLRTTVLSLLSGLVLAISAGNLVACSEVDEAFDCQQICTRYKDCFDANYDVEACRNRCETNADNENGFAAKADSCETCLDDRSCSGSFGCASECIGVVP